MQRVELNGWATTQPKRDVNVTTSPKVKGKNKQNHIKGALTPGNVKFKKVVNSQVAAIQAKKNKDTDKNEGENTNKRMQIHSCLQSWLLPLLLQESQQLLLVVPNELPPTLVTATMQ